MLKGLRDFLFRGNVVDLAVAVVVGAAFTALVTAFVADLLTPLIAALVGSPDFSGLAFTVNGSTFRYGHFVNALVSFLLVGTSVYFAVIVPLRALDRRRKAGAPEPAKPVPEDVRVLTEIRDLLRERTSALPLADGSAPHEPRMPAGM